jgi:hypothetical protein
MAQSLDLAAEAGKVDASILSTKGVPSEPDWEYLMPREDPEAHDLIAETLFELEQERRSRHELLRRPEI